MVTLQVMSMRLEKEYLEFILSSELPLFKSSYNMYNILQFLFIFCLIIFPRNESDPVILSFSTCSHIRHITALYLSLICLLILSVTFCIVGTSLGIVGSLCTHLCQPKVRQLHIITFSDGVLSIRKYQSLQGAVGAKWGRSIISNGDFPQISDFPCLFCEWDGGVNVHLTFYICLILAECHNNCSF